MNNKKYTTAAKVVADLLGGPGIETEVKENLARRKKLDALVAERAKAGLTIRDVAKRMRITQKQVLEIEECWEDRDLLDFPKVRKAYVAAIRQKGGAK